MAKIKETDSPELVTAFINKLSPDFANLINDIRRIILDTDVQIGEHIKWNSPAFFSKEKCNLLMQKNTNVICW